MKHVYMATATIIIIADDDVQTSAPNAAELVSSIESGLDGDSHVIECLIAPAKFEVCE